MTFDNLLSALGYQGSPHFLRRGDRRFQTESGFGHVFRRAAQQTGEKAGWRVEGVYGLRDSVSGRDQFVPVVYVCQADHENAARQLHRLVWNQDVVPYVLVREPKGLKVYAGFNFDPEGKTDSQRGVLRALSGFEHAQSIIELFKARSIDEGSIWKRPELRVDSRGRVYHRLLRDLRELDKWLRGEGRLQKRVSHALIGKYVYLRYLRDRGILSPDRLTNLWGIPEADIFSRNATKVALEKLTDKLDDWLNGEIFPLRLSGDGAPTSDHVRRVAAIFGGDEMKGDSTQTTFDFNVYDFSYIPIETLSLIYEQFLHAEDSEEPTIKKKGREAGAYYTPIPLVNLMLGHIQERLSLKKGMRICDPSCGSGAFLVQAYRRLIETTFDVSKPPKPEALKQLLQSSIFGVDVDGDACQVTQLSLILTLLDYVDPPDLTGKNTSFKLPSLLNRNIFEGNFFGIESRLRAAAEGKGFDWIVGNPPWKQLKKDAHGGADAPVWDWMVANDATHPVGMYQTAQAFAWEVSRYLTADGECGLLVPAMGLFEEPSEGFRKAFFRRFRVHTVANFANLAEVLFDGRARVPAAALFFQLRPNDVEPSSDEAITTYSLFVANQEATRLPDRAATTTGTTGDSNRRERGKLWSLVVNGSEVRTVELADVATGSGLPWKLSMWGTPWDDRLIRRMERKWPSLRTVEENDFLLASEGLQLREDENRAAEKLDEVPEARGQLCLNVDLLKRKRDVFAFPKDSLVRLDKKPKFARAGRAELPLKICRPPHIIVSAARNFAVYSEEFIIVPPRQIGIISPTNDSVLLKALSLYLSSDFAFYHQFLSSSQAGIKRDVATLEALRRIPIPLMVLGRSDLTEWVDLHTKLVKCAPRQLHVRDEEAEQGDLFDEARDTVGPLLLQLNNLTDQALGLDEREQALVHDLVRVRLHLNDGKLGYEAMRLPTEIELRAYARRLKRELDDFIGDDADRLHQVTVVRDRDSAMIEVDFTQDRVAARKIQVVDADAEVAAKLRRTRDRLLEARAQWVYFNRSLRVYRGHKTYLFKPLQRFQWTESAAMMDASDLIAETVAASD